MVGDEDLGGVGVPAGAARGEVEVGAVGLEDGRGLPAEADLKFFLFIFFWKIREREKKS